MQELLSTSPIVTMVNRHQSASTPLNDQDQKQQEPIVNKQTQFQFNGSKQQDDNSSNNNNNNNESNNSSPSFHQDYSITNEFYKANIFQPAIKIEPITSSSLNNSNFSVNNLANLNTFNNHFNGRVNTWRTSPNSFTANNQTSSSSNESTSSESSSTGGITELSSFNHPSSSGAATFKPYIPSYANTQAEFNSYYSHAQMPIPPYFNRLPVCENQQFYPNQNNAENNYGLNSQNLITSLSSSSSSSFSTSPSSSSSSSNNANNNVSPKILNHQQMTSPANFSSQNQNTNNNNNNNQTLTPNSSSSIAKFETYEWMKPVKSNQNGMFYLKLGFFNLFLHFMVLLPIKIYGSI
jgi:hypothetical protein